MKKFIVGLIAGLLFVCVAEAQVPAPLFSEQAPVPEFNGGLADHIRKHTVRVAWPLGNNEWSVGSGTVIYPANKDGSWAILTATHVVRHKDKEGGPEEVLITLPDGKKIKGKVRVVNRQCDVAWLVTDDKDLKLHSVALAKSTPKAGAAVAHSGLGGKVFRKGGLYKGVNNHNMAWCKIVALNGDSGCGVYREDTKEVVGVLSCGFANTKDTWIGSCEEAWRLRGVLDKSLAASKVAPSPAPRFPSPAWCPPGGF